MMLKFSLQNLSTIFFFSLAIILICKTFYNLLAAFKQKKTLLKTNNLISSKAESLFRVELIRPLIFIKYFAACLAIPFLSQYILNAALKFGLSSEIASIAYVSYQVIFMLMIVPSGYIMEIGSIKRLLLITFALEALIYITLGLTSNFWIIFCMQIMFGIVIPLSSSAEYAYIIAFSANDNRSEMLALYSNTTKGAMISGIFLGGILASRIGEHHTLLLSGILISTCLLYIIFLISNIDCKAINCGTIQKEIKEKSNISLHFKDLIVILKDYNFLKIILFVAFPIGILRDGIFLYSLPIILTRNHIAHSVIGKIMVLFSIGFFMTNKFISKKADQAKTESSFLFFGLIGSAFALFLISGLNLTHLFGIENHQLGLYFLSIGLLVLGLFRGFLLSPSMGSISKSKTASIIGKNVAISIYRLCEVSGKIIGPILIALLLAYSNFSSITFMIIGGLIFVFALLFQAFSVFKQM